MQSQENTNSEMNKTSICLIIPPSPFLLDERVFMHLGVLKVASSLESKGVNVDVLDLSAVKNIYDVIDDYVKLKEGSSTFGITATTPQVPVATKICRHIKSISVEHTVILGGPHVTLMNAASKMEKNRGLDKSSRATEDLSLIHISEPTRPY